MGCSQRLFLAPAHTDLSSITLLFQDDYGGLEVEDVSCPGIFVPATPIQKRHRDERRGFIAAVEQRSVSSPCICVSPNQYRIDYLRSTSHRVTLPPFSDRFEGAQRMTRRRFSIPYFLSPDPESVIECIPSGTDEPPKYQPIIQAEYNRMRASVQH